MVGTRSRANRDRTSDGNIRCSAADRTRSGASGAARPQTRSRHATPRLVPIALPSFALCPGLDIASQGESIDQAVANLKEAVERFLEVTRQNEIEGRLKKPSLFTYFEATRA